MLFFIHFESRRVDIGNLPLGLAAIEKAKAIGAKTQRERDFINAMVAFYTELGRERKYAPFLARTRRRRAAKDGVGCRLLTRNGHDWTKRPGRGERAARARLALPGSRLEAIIDLARDGHDDCRVRLDRAGIWSGTCERESLQKLRFLTIGPTLGASYFSPR